MNVDPSSLTVTALKAQLEDRGLDTRGRKAVLVKRLQDALDEDEDEKDDDAEWEWKDDGGFEAYDGATSDQIEAAFNSKKKKVKLSKGWFRTHKNYVVDFNIMMQSNTSTDCHRTVRRVTSSSSSSSSSKKSKKRKKTPIKKAPKAKKQRKKVVQSSDEDTDSSDEDDDDDDSNVIWEWKGDDGFGAYKDENSDEIERAFNGKKKKVRLAKGFFKKKHYEVDFSKKPYWQSDVVNDRHRHVRRIDLDEMFAVKQSVRLQKGKSWFEIERLTKLSCRTKAGKGKTQTGTMKSKKKSEELLLQWMWKTVKEHEEDEYQLVEIDDDEDMKSDDDDDDGKKSSLDSFYTEFRGRTAISEAQYKDTYGNARGNQYDLVRDNAMKGYSILVIQLYNESAFDFKQPGKALKEKGFNVIRHTSLPSAAKFKSLLKNCCQCWVISGSAPTFTKKHVEHLKDFFDSGKGICIWGDNDPYVTDANAITKAIFKTDMSGNDYGGQTVKETRVRNKAGFLKHFITTGIENLFEGITIATVHVKKCKHLDPVVWSSVNKVVTAYYDFNGKRAIIDGGFTRLYCNWDTAGSARFVKNAAGWLVNLESQL